MSKRKHCRAPLYTSVIAEVNKGVQKVKGVNISQGGVLLDDLPVDMPETFQVLFSLARFPDFSKVDRKILSMMTRHSLDHDIVRATVRLSRRGKVRQSFCHGYEFVKFNDDFQKNILNYSIQMVGNLSYYLNLFELYDRGDKKEKDEDYIRALANLLGHVERDEVVSLSSLRARGLHDFQNLDQL